MTRIVTNAQTRHACVTLACSNDNIASSTGRVGVQRMNVNILMKHCRRAVIVYRRLLHYSQAAAAAAAAVVCDSAVALRAVYYCYAVITAVLYPRCVPPVCLSIFQSVCPDVEFFFCRLHCRSARLRTVLRYRPVKR